MHCTDLNYGRCGIQWRNALCKVWKLRDGSQRFSIIAECVPLDVALVFRFIKFYRTAALSDNTVANYIANTMIFAYRSIMGQNVTH